jgi:HK97 family phage major capsid protein
MLKELKDKLAASVKAQNAILDKVAAGTATEDEIKQMDTLDKEIATLDKAIDIAVKAEERENAAKTPATDPIHAEANDHKPIWNGFGEFLNAVRKAAVPDNRIVDPRLIQNAASGTSEGVLEDGGFLVQSDFVTELLKRTYETGLLAPRCRRIPISAKANGLKMNTVEESSRANGSRWGGVQSFWEGEADLFTGSKPKFGLLELNLKKLIGLCYATGELLSDTTALESVIMQAFAEEFGFKLDDAIFRGTGAGQPLGFTNSPSLIKVPKTASQTADTITLANIQNMWMRMWGRSRLNSIWLINQECEGQLNSLVLSTGTSTGISVYMPPSGVSGSSYNTIYGRPVIPIEQASALGDEGDISLVDLSQYMLIDKGGVNSAVSIHVRFLYDESVYRFIYRVDGQTIWKSPLTPYKGANTLSPFVTLAERA